MSNGVKREPIAYRPNRVGGRTMLPAIVVVAHGLVAAWHLGVGSNPYMVVMFTMISIIGIQHIFRERIWPSDFFIFGLSIYSGGAALLAKALLGQPLQSNLMHPVFSTSVLTLSFFAALAGATLARAIQRYEGGVFWGRLGMDRPSQYLPMLILGAAFFLLHVMLRPRFENGVQTSGGFGGFGSFYFIFVFGVAAAAFAYGKSRDRKARLVLILSFAMMMVMSIVANTKKELADFVLVIILMAIAFRIRMRPVPLLLGILLFYGLVAFVVPLIQLMRSDFTTLGMGERLGHAWTLLADANFNPAVLAEAQSRILRGFSFSFREYGSYIFPSAINLDRFFLILPVDQVARGVLEGKQMGVADFILRPLVQAMPSFLVSKDGIAGSDLVGWEYGIRSVNSIARPVIGLAASLLAAGGVIAVVIGSFVIVALVFSVYNFTFGHLRRSTFGLFFLVISSSQFEAALDAMIIFFLRTYLFIAIFFAFVVLFQRTLRLLPRKHRAVGALPR